MRKGHAPGEGGAGGMERVVDFICDHLIMVNNIERLIRFRCHGSNVDFPGIKRIRNWKQLSNE